MKIRNDFIRALTNYHKQGYNSYESIFSLQQEMLKLGVCPRCGTPSRRWSSVEGKFPCYECGFWITPNEVEKVLSEKKPNKSILIKRLKEKK